MSAVSIQESSGQIHDGLAPPVHYQSRALSYNSHRHSFQIFLLGIAKEGIYIFGIYHYGHTFLGLGNGDFCAVQAGVLLRHLVQIDLQTCCQFADSYGYAACTEVVALLNDLADFFSPEQSLDLSFSRRISFLYFCAAGLNRFLCVYLGRTCCSAAAVTSRTSA